MHIEKRLHFTSLDSTNAYALRAGIVPRRDEAIAIRADIQHAGQGRRGASFFSATPTGIWATLVLPDTPQHFVYNRAISLAVAEVLAARCAEAALRIKWPNDIECNGKKICGILLQSLPGRRTGLVLGVGVNITTRCEQFPAAIAHRVTSLYLETGMNVSIEAVYEELLDAFCRWCVVPVQTAHQAYTARLRGLDTRVMVDGRPAWFHGVAADGRACVTVDGRTTYVSHAGIRFDPVRARTTAKERTT